MKALILAWWYATRLFPLTQNFPKPLIPINNEPMIDRIITKIEKIHLHDIVVVTNEKYYPHFQQWKKTRKKSDKTKIEIVNDRTMSNDDRLWAIGDIHHVMHHYGIDDDLFVICGDNLFRFGLEESYALFKKYYQPTIIWYDVRSLDEAKKFWVIDVSSEGKVLSFVEKPENPPSTLTSIGIYYYPRHTLRLIDEYIMEGHSIENPLRRQKWQDAPWFLVGRLVNKVSVYAQIHTEKWYDVWTFASLEEAKKDFWEINVDIEKLQRGEF